MSPLCCQWLPIIKSAKSKQQGEGWISGAKRGLDSPRDIQLYNLRETEAEMCKFKEIRAENSPCPNQTGEQNDNGQAQCQLYKRLRTEHMTFGEGKTHIYCAKQATIYPKTTPLLYLYE